MSNPYALDFNPLAQAFQNKAQVDLARNRLSMDEDRLAMEQQRQAWEGELQPFRVTQARLGNETAEQGLKRDREMLPLDLAGKKASNAGQNLQNTRYRQDIEDHVAKQFGGVMQVIQDRLKADPNDQWALSEYRKVVTHPDYRSTMTKWRVDPNDPTMGTRLFIARGQGYKDPLDDRLKTLQVESAEAEAQAMKDWRASQQPVPARLPSVPPVVQQPSASPAPAVPGATPIGPPPAPSNAAPQVSPQTMAPMPPALQNATDGPLLNLRDQWLQAQRMLMGPKALWPAAEKTLDRINKEIEKGVTIGRSGNVVPVPGAQEAQARAKELETAAQKRGDSVGTAQASLPDAERSASFMLKKIQAIEDHPALSRSTGAVGGRTWAITPEAKDLQAKLAEVQGATFMQAFQSLRGGGQITEKEGEKATAALSRLQEQRVGTDEYIRALKDFKSEIMSLYDLAQRKAGATPTPAPPSKGDVFRMDGAWYQYLDGPLNDPKSYKQVNR